MQWKIKLSIILFIAIPAISGFPLKNFDAVVIPGLSWSRVLYFFGIHFSLRVILGLHRYGQVTGIAALITLPVIYSGAGLSYALWFVGNGSQNDLSGFGIHYLNLAVNMLTVIPLSLAIVALLPFSTFEQHLLQRADGVTAMEKRLLMAVRVFNHIVFDVLPNILEVMREENYYRTALNAPFADQDKFSLKIIIKRLMEINSKMVQIGVEGICSAMQYIPLWAVELSQLPQRKRLDKKDRP